MLNCATVLGVFSRLFFVSLITALWCAVSFAQDLPAGKIVNIRGRVDVYKQKSKVSKPAKEGELIEVGDAVSTFASSLAAILLADETLLQLHHDTRFVLTKVAFKAKWHSKRAIIPVSHESSQSSYWLEKGEAWIRNKNRGLSIRFDTPTMVIGVRGTEMDIKVTPDDTATLTVLEGTAQAQNEFGSMDVGAREQVIARPRAPMLKRVLLTPEDAVQWTIPIPPFFEDRDIPANLHQAVQALRNGEVKEAQRLTKELVDRSPDQSPAWSLNALTSLMLGQKQQAMEAADRAVKTGPQSSTALLVKSYAHQAAFDLEGALTATEKALVLDPNNISALVNLSQLQFGMDYTDRAFATIGKALQLAPDNGEVQNLLGFILLAKEQTTEAIAAFGRAIQADPGLGEPHMGLGIAYMRRGDVDAAMEEMTTATLLDPRRSLFLSYWAKMLYQIGRYEKALDMLMVAGEIDPQDPTPELYKSFIYKDRNRPTEAIRAVNQSMFLNDNRAVYRSRFLLDRDAAVKNVDLSILYNQLGLSGWARSKALASVKQDYTNASGHLFLAGALRDADDRSWPMASEFLLARMLVPANINTFNTFNEYTAFFERPGVNGTLTGSISDHNGKAGDVVAYGAVPAANIAFGTQVSYAGTDGWRNTNGEETKNAVALVKWNLTPKDGFMAVASYQKAYQKDRLYPRYEFYPRVNNDKISDPADWLDNELARFELGYHRNFSPNSNLLIYAAHVGSSGTLYDKSAVTMPLFGPIDSTGDYRRPYTQIQAQYLHKLGAHQLILGTNQSWGDNNLTSTLYLSNWSLTLPATQNKKNNQLQTYYVQDIWSITRMLTVEGALYLDRMENSDAGYGTDWTLTNWGGRLGFIVTPTRKDTFRIAAFRYLLPFITSRLDPTDIAGIPVFRNNDEGSLMEEYHAVWEHEWASGYFSTDIFHLEKQYTHKIVNAGSEVMRDEGGRMTGCELLLNQLLWRGFGLMASYRYQNVTGDKFPIDGRSDLLPINDREDHLFNVGLRYVHTSGVSAGISESYRWQRFRTGNWVDAQTWPADGRMDQHVWLTDVLAAYEFPQKRGSLKFEVRNIFDNRFNWVTDNFVFKGRAPAREMVFTVSLNF